MPHAFQLCLPGHLSRVSLQVRDKLDTISKADTFHQVAQAHQDLSQVEI